MAETRPSDVQERISQAVQHEVIGRPPRSFRSQSPFGRQYRRSESVIRNSLRRYERKGLVERVSPKLFINHLNQQFSPQELVNIIRPRSYISLESALVEGGIINQSPSALTCVASAPPRSYHAKSVTITYRRINDLKKCLPMPQIKKSAILYKRPD